MTSPASWYPAARSLRRRIVAHLGPTNSGEPTSGQIYSLVEKGSAKHLSMYCLLPNGIACLLSSCRL